MIWCWRGRVRTPSKSKTWNSPVTAGTAYLLHKQNVFDRLDTFNGFLYLSVSLTLLVIKRRLNTLSLRTFISSNFLSHLFVHDVSTYFHNKRVLTVDNVKERHCKLLKVSRRSDTFIYFIGGLLYEIHCPQGIQ